MRVIAIDVADIVTDHAHRLFDCRWFALIQFLDPLLIPHQRGRFIGYTGSPEGGDEPFELLLEGLEEPLDDLGFGIVAFCEVSFDTELGEDATQLQFQIMVIPLFMKELTLEGFAIIEIHALR